VKEGGREGEEKEGRKEETKGETNCRYK